MTWDTALSPFSNSYLRKSESHSQAGLARPGDKPYQVCWRGITIYKEAEPWHPDQIIATTIYYLQPGHCKLEANDDDKETVNSSIFIHFPQS